MSSYNSFRRQGNKLIHTRLLDAPRELVWEVWTQAEHLREWWGPDGFSITNHGMQVGQGGHWRFTMHGFGQDYENDVQYLKVEKPRSLSFRNGNENDALSFLVEVTFEVVEGKTLMTMTSIFSSAEVLDQLNREVNAIEGGKQTIGRLEAYVNAQFQLRKQSKITKMARTSTYLNFPDQTEAAFNFYKSVFGTEFGGNGIQRFGDLPSDPSTPPLSDADKKLILHIELPIVGGHVLMGTDAPESMGFQVIHGNNVHINLEPDSRAETTRLFNALSEGGKVSMPLQDMFWGAYFGSCTDKYGINWMFNCDQA